MDSDVVYYTRRAIDEREAALAAETEKARQSHLELAKAYESRLIELRAKKTRSTLTIVTAP